MNDFDSFNYGDFFRLNIYHNDHGQITESIFCKFVSRNYLPESNYLESITVNQIIGIDQWINKLTKLDDIPTIERIIPNTVLNGRIRIYFNGHIRD